MTIQNEDDLIRKLKRASLVDMREILCSVNIHVSLNSPTVIKTFKSGKFTYNVYPEELEALTTNGWTPEEYISCLHGGVPSVEL